MAELNIAIICASLPLIRPLAKLVMPKWFNGSSGSNGLSSSRDGASIRMGAMQQSKQSYQTKRSIPTTVIEGYGSSEEALATPGVQNDRGRERTRDRDFQKHELAV